MSTEGKSTGKTSADSSKDYVAQLISPFGIIEDPDSDSSRRQAYARVKFLLYVEIGEDSLQLENHMKRLHNLRKELYYIKKTDWQYEPIDKLIGQS
ncbi:uncharacterized protein LOC132259452 [Phlebotomus argentipes]|uniref:uncharacterized protein LOC132259452 n=1 Tax=Phlebotomus argentipes TaxID=94469 RepID=UPI002892EC2A|nr:uncharacterized protein LOC132259452 [Phlebotomus argentipes]